MIYTRGCSFRCPFCHNRELVEGSAGNPVSSGYVFSELSKRVGFIDGVVITGGEPALHNDLPDFISRIKAAGFRVKLDTNGSHPEMLETLLSEAYLDYVAMDIKTAWPKYSAAAGRDIDIGAVERSFQIIKNSQIDHEFRTTCVPGLVDAADILEISLMLGKNENYTLQQFQSASTLDPKYSKISPYSQETLGSFLRIAEENIGRCRLIGV